MSSRPKSKPNKKPSSLKSGRPPLLSTATALSRASSKVTRTLIRKHHNLHKSRAKALADDDTDLLANLDEQIQQLGGLDAYQNASLTGQSKDRGGDSSVVLVKWLEDAGLVRKLAQRQEMDDVGMRVLEVGALSSKNCISSQIGRGVASVRRIDLKSQESGMIEEIDFMAFPVPDIKEGYDVISLSLVLNYVPHSQGRGDMLKRTRLFLRKPNVDNSQPNQSNTLIEGRAVLPCLFVVLPLPCLSNSRYMTADRFREMMSTLGFVSLRTHQSVKLHYELFHYQDSGQSLDGDETFKKLEVNSGKNRNNFCITLDGG